MSLEPLIDEIGLDELQAILQRAKTAIDDDEYEKLKAAVDTLVFLTNELEKKDISIKRLRQLIFGASTEKTSQVFNDASQSEGPAEDGESAEAGADGAAAEGKGEKDEAKKRPGHGRNGAADYTGAERVRIAHESLQSGASCPECDKGKVYPQKEPAAIVRIAALDLVGPPGRQLERNLAHRHDGGSTSGWDEGLPASGSGRLL